MNKTDNSLLKVQKIQDRTIKDVLNKLKEHHKCLLVRPTGFGKTKTSIDIMRYFDHAIFLYPFNNIANAVRKYDIDDLDLHLYSFTKMRNMYNKAHSTFVDIFSNFNQENTIFVIDEAHFIGAPGTSKFIEALMNTVCPKANYFGITATPNRTDKLDIKWHYFDGITAFEYNLKEAFEDEIYYKPYYVYTPLNGTDLEQYYINKINNSSVSKAKKDQLKAKIKSIIDPQKLCIENLPEIIRNNLYKFKNDIDYYKFICFFSTFNDIHRKRKEIISAFSLVFPHCEINTIIVSSENKQYRSNLKEIDNLKRRKNTIDLIFNVSMLTFGYHVDDISGIIMFRQTLSNIIYVQQVGRCLSVVQKHHAIIFDFVENLYKSSTYSVIDENKNSNKNINSIDLLLPKDSITLNELYNELLKIDRLINNSISEEFEREVIKAYKTNLVDMEYCITKLQLQDVDDFQKVLERY